jgi:hypothetical protein
LKTANLKLAEAGCLNLQFAFFNWQFSIASDWRLPLLPLPLHYPVNAVFRSPAGQDGWR